MSSWFILTYMSQQQQSGKILLRVSTAADMLDVSRTQVYNLINVGVLRAVKVGKSIRIPMAAVQELAQGVGK
jgi:excisionase family DNA binding protein